MGCHSNPSGGNDLRINRFVVPNRNLGCIRNPNQIRLIAGAGLEGVLDSHTGISGEPKTSLNLKLLNAADIRERRLPEVILPLPSVVFGVSLGLTPQKPLVSFD